MPQDAHRAPGAAGDPAAPSPFRLAVVPGVNPAKWLRVWEQRLPDVRLQLVPVPAAGAEATLLARTADAALLRVPVDRTLLSAIPLYTETTVVVVPVDHLVAAADEVTAADLADDVLLAPGDDVLAWADRPGGASALPAPATTADAVELVAAGVGVLVVPQSLARLHHRRDLTYRPVTDAPTSSVGLAWLTDDASYLVEELVGIVRGRTANSSRGRASARTDGGGKPASTPGARSRDGGPGPAAGAAGTHGSGARRPDGPGARGGPHAARGGPQAGRGGPQAGRGGRKPGGRGGSGRGKGTGRSR
jgi:DNA-binding transcriptional LysR family regulator